MRERFTRRAVLGTLGVGAVGAVGAAAGAWSLTRSDQATVRQERPEASAYQQEDSRPAPHRARTGNGVFGGTARVADDRAQQIKGYTDATSVNRGGSITFYVTVNPAGPFDIAIRRLGYREVGASTSTETDVLLRSPRLTGVSQPAPTATPDTRTVTAAWSPSWTLRLPPQWPSGHYVAELTSQAGFQNYVPFVVRDDARRADFLLVAPYTTYQAYNQYPYDGRLGASLYHAWDARGRWQNEAQAATKVSFDRPYAESGLPTLFDIDRRLITWAERGGYDVSYATSVDLHTGQIDPTQYKGIVFTGHDEYWSTPMRAVAERAVASGVSLAFMAANSVYWHVRFEPSAESAVGERVMVCYKARRDPDAVGVDRTTLWRDLGLPEQRLVGAQYISMVNGRHPLVVSSPEHWFWAGCGVRAGTVIKDVVSGEADQVMHDVGMPEARWFATLASSPYPDTRHHTRTQNTTLHQTASGAYVFVAGTFGWCRALSDPSGIDPRVQRATANLFDRIKANPAGTLT
jgi:hypothetical protein